MNYFKFVFIVALMYWGLYLIATIARIVDKNPGFDPVIFLH